MDTDNNLVGSLELFKCQEDVAPRWAQTVQDVPSPLVSRVGKVDVTFTEADFRDGQYKLCDDGVYRRRLHAKVKVLCAHYTRTLRVTVTSANGLRTLGTTVFRFDENADG